MIQPTKISKTFCLNCFREQTWDLSNKNTIGTKKSPVIFDNTILCCEKPNRKWITDQEDYNREALIKRAMEKLS